MITRHFAEGIEQYYSTSEMPTAAAYGIGLSIVGAGAGATLYISDGVNWTSLSAGAIAALLTGFTSGAGTVAATDTVLEAIQKLDGNIALKATDLLTGFTSGAGTVAATDTVLQAIQKLDGNIALKATDLLTGFTSGAGTVAATDTVLQAIQKLDGNIALKADASAASDGTFYVAASSGGAVTTSLTFTDGVLTAIA